MKKIFLLAFLLGGLATGGMLYWTSQPIHNGPEAIDFSIKSGSSVRSAGKQMQEAGVPLNPLLFELLARVTGKANKLKAGSYDIEPGKTPADLLDKIVNGDFSFVSLSIIEGWTFQQMRKVIDSHPSIQHTTAGLSDTELMRKIDADFAQPEGVFFPDTYLFAKGSSDLEIYRQAHSSMLKKLSEAWTNRNHLLPYKTAYEALTMASIIEKETGQKAERTLIAAVFINRLRIGMLLQTDPTVIYGMGEQYKGKIRKHDLLTDTPYNTYTRTGLPPTPIALPGIASLTAAFNPAQSDALYFVAKGDGTSHFSDNLTEHNRAVNKYQR
ncbi:endolytic transglycosylase MltG [Undibacterium sp. Jales W-56]|nr:endolytic transglycosylase MltG [Undibacterium sp. Jales W-56]MCU6433386.1 endolytic transglycosylase MltG [Undibacterium sp. Jales W-56]